MLKYIHVLLLLVASSSSLLEMKYEVQVLKYIATSSF